MLKLKESLLWIVFMVQSGARFIYNGSVFNHTIRDVLLLNQMTSSHYPPGPGPGPMRPGQDTVDNQGHWSVANFIDNCRTTISSSDKIIKIILQK